MSNSYVYHIGKMQIMELYPDEYLLPYIEKYTFYENSNLTNDWQMKVFTNGKIEMFIHYDGCYILVLEKNKTIMLDNFIINIYELNNPLIIKPLTRLNCFKGICITFKLKGIINFFNFNSKLMSNKTICLGEILGNNYLYLINRISEASNNFEIKNILDKFFILTLNEEVQSFLIDNIYNYIIKNNGCLSVKDLSNHFNITCRTIQRIFNEYIGIKPKEFLKIIRFNHACKLISENLELDWFNIVCDCGYYDQMHFIHEFKSIMKHTPIKFLKDCNNEFYFKRPFIKDSKN